MDNLAIHFRERLLRHKSEPRANSFTISGGPDDVEVALRQVLDVLRRAQLIYTRSGPAKDSGRREVYYVPSRLLWPERAWTPTASMQGSPFRQASCSRRLGTISEFHSRSTMTRLDKESSSMNGNSVLITCASWEDRFARGFANDIDELSPTSVILYYLDAYATWSHGNRKSPRRYACARHFFLRACTHCLGLR